MGKFKGRNSCAACYQSCPVNMITAFTQLHIKSQMFCDVSTIVNSKGTFINAIFFFFKFVSEQSKSKFFHIVPVDTDVNRKTGPGFFTCY